MGIKITASVERVFRLHLAAPNDTICLLRAFVSFESVTVLLWSGAVFYYIRLISENV